jgi:hypothetical protein
VDGGGWTPAVFLWAEEASIILCRWSSATSRALGRGGEGACCRVASRAWVMVRVRVGVGVRDRDELGGAAMAPIEIGS